MPRPIFSMLHMFVHFRTVRGRNIPPERLFQMLTWFFQTGAIGKERPPIMLYCRPDSLKRIAFRMMYWKKKYLMPWGCRQYLNSRFFISLSLHLLQQPCAQPLFFPDAPSLRQPWPQVALAHLAWHDSVAAHRMQGTALQDNQTPRWHMAASWHRKPPLAHGPVKRGMLIACAMLRFTRQQRPRQQPGLLHGMDATPPASLPTHPLHQSIV